MSDIVSYLKQHFSAPKVGAFPARAQDLLNVALAHDPCRVEHVRGVCRTASRLARALRFPPEQVQHLLEAALLHDIGYSPELRQTGFHPLDGAAFLAHRGFAPKVVEATLFHTGARAEAAFHPAAAPVYQKFSAFRSSPVADALTYCDLRTSPAGELITRPERLWEIRSRYGPEHPASRSVEQNRDDFERLGRQTVRQIALAAPERLPWVFMDVDATLLARGVALSEQNRQMIARYTGQGGRISLATGKHPLGIEDLIQKTGLGGINLALNGCILMDGAKCTTLWHLGDKAEPLIRLLKKEKIAFNAYDEDGILCDFSAITSEQLELLASYHEPTPTPLPTKPHKPYVKLLMYVDAQETRRESMLRDIGREHGVSVVRTSRYFLEFVPPGSGKGAAMNHVLEQTGWPDFHTVALGDSENDLDMLRQSGWAMAVSNATESVLRAADQVVAPCAQNGVAEALQLLLEQGEN